MKRPCGCTTTGISRQFGSMEHFKSCFKEAALSVFGSGYAWPIWENGGLCITTSANQNTPHRAAAGHRCLGTRLLSEALQHARRLHRRLVPGRKLVLRGSPFPPLPDHMSSISCSRPLPVFSSSFLSSSSSSGRAALIFSRSRSAPGSISYPNDRWRR